MSRETQIDEMAQIIKKPCVEIFNEAGEVAQASKCPFPYECEECAAINLYNAGYRKQSEPISCGHEKGGEWKLGESGCMYFCSECNYAAHPREVDEWNYCPRCGAKTKGE